MKQKIVHIDLNGVNCYLSKTDEGFILFDTGGHLLLDKEYSDRQEELIKSLEKAGCMPGDLKAIVLTHGDNDHSGNAAFLRDKYGAVIAMHSDDVNLVEDLTMDKMMESFHFRTIPYKIVFRLMKKQIIKITTKNLNGFMKFKPDILLKDGDDLLKFGFHAKVIHLPGHTPGSIGILCEGGELISGDIFANMKKPALALNAYDLKQMKKSAAKLKSMNITTIYPGHGKPFAAKDLRIGIG